MVKSSEAAAAAC